jgi:hypothetical protein
MSGRPVRQHKTFVILHHAAHAEPGCPALSSQSHVLIRHGIAPPANEASAAEASRRHVSPVTRFDTGSAVAADWSAADQHRAEAIDVIDTTVSEDASEHRW